MKLSTIATDEKLENEGTLIRIPETTIQARIARSNSPRYKSRLRELLEPHIDRFVNERIPESIMEECTVRAMAECILLDLIGAEEDDGTPIKYTPDVGVRVLGSQRYADLREWILREAGKIDNYRARRVSDDVGNSDGASLGA